MEEFSLSKVYQLLELGPMVACVVSSADYSFAALRATRECVIAIPTLELAPIVVQPATHQVAISINSRLWFDAVAGRTGG